VFSFRCLPWTGNLEGITVDVETAGGGGGSKVGVGRQNQRRKGFMRAAGCVYYREGMVIPWQALYGVEGTRG